MNPAPDTATPAVVAPPAREPAVDLFRGFVLLTMYYANCLPKALPWWMYHGYHTKTPVSTWVDFVWPAFLFAAGLSIPMSMSARLQRGGHWSGIVGHILFRGIGLIWIGALYSWDPYDGRVLGIADAIVYRHVTLAAILAAFIPWQRLFGSGQSVWRRRLPLVLRLAGWAWLIYATVTIRFAPKGPDGNVVVKSMIDYLRAVDVPPSVICSFGYAFLWVAPIWWFTRRNRALRIALMALCILALQHWETGGYLRRFVANAFVPLSPVDNRLLYVLGGTLLGDALLEARGAPAIFRRWALVLFLVCVAGLALVDGKASGQILTHNMVQRALATIAFSTLILYVIWETSRRWRGWFWFPLHTLGLNTLLGYLMQQSSIFHLPQKWSGLWLYNLIPFEGWVGLGLPTVYIVFYVLLLHLFNRKRLFLRL